MAAGLAIAVYAVVIVVTVFSGNSDAPWLPMPAEGKGAGKVGTRSSEPTPSTSTAQSPGATPESSATGSAVPGASAAPGASASPSAGDSASGKPSTGTSPSGRPTGGKTTPPVEPSGPADSDEPSTDPTEPTDPTTPDDPASDPAGGPVTDGSEALAEGGLVQLLVAPLVQPLDSLVPSLESSVL